MKIFFDVSGVALAIVLSLVFFDFLIVGTQEGTVISALLTGVVVKFFSRRIKAPLNTLLSR